MSTGNRGGRPRKPTEVHLLAGNPSKIKDLEQIAAHEPHPAKIAAVPKPPSYLSKPAKQCWRDNAAMLMNTGLLTQADINAFEAYCNSYGNYVMAVQALNAVGTVTYKPQVGTQPDSEYVDERPEARAIRAWAKEMREWAREFGMTPAARGRMVLPDKSKTTDDMEDILQAVGK